VKFGVAIQARSHAEFLDRSIDCSENYALRILVKNWEAGEEVAFWKSFNLVYGVFLQVIDEQGRPLLADQILTKVI
jgi:hypothetical protein